MIIPRHTTIIISHLTKRSFATFIDSKPLYRPPPASPDNDGSTFAEIGPLPEYQRRIAMGLLKPDQEQFQAVVRLQKLCEDLLDYEPPAIKALPGKPLWQRGFKLLGKDGGAPKTKENSFAGSSMIPLWMDSDDSPEFVGPRGLWIHGEVGTGKTLLLDLFHSTFPTSRKLRTHFHPFLSSLLVKLNDFNSLHPTSPAKLSTPHPTMSVARDIILTPTPSSPIWLISFDEFQVTDVASAVILRQVLSHMFGMGCVMVVTSNRAPEELYQGGFQRSVYGPFVDLIRDRCEVLRVRGKRDYRVLLADEKPAAATEEMYFNLSDGEAIGRYMERVMKLFQNQERKKQFFEVYGRKVIVPAATQDGKAIFRFDQLCGSNENPLGPVDYLELCSRYHTILVQTVPVMGMAMKNEARRFITFLDAAYENRTKVIMSADDTPENLFVMEPPKPTETDSADPTTSASSPATPPQPQQQEESPDAVMHREMLGDLLGGFEVIRNPTSPTGFDVRRLAILSGSDERFAFRRAVSRIKEMGSEVYLKTPHAPWKVDWRGLETVKGVEGADDVGVKLETEKAKEGVDQPKLTKPLETQVVTEPVAVIGSDHPRGLRVAEMGAEAYGDDFGEEAGYRGMVVRMNQRLASNSTDGHGGKTGIVETLRKRFETSTPKIQETHFWGAVPWSKKEEKAGRVGERRNVAFWSNMHEKGEGGEGEGQGGSSDDGVGRNQK
ncbi:hypothetical protein HDU97_008043 [Phlyctochytrium planicorne]|nr:hypothetical protein HDU97_008043 [Phlyctochytrium planicorne]